MPRFQIGDTCRLAGSDELEIVIYAGSDENFGSGALPDYDVRQRLEFLRGELRAERISSEELSELQGLAAYIEAGDVELLEAAGVPEGEVPANENYVRIFYETPNANEFAEAFVPLRRLEPAPHHLGDALRKAFFRHATETKRYLARQRGKGRKK